MKRLVMPFLTAVFLAVPLFAQSEAGAPEVWVVDKPHSAASFRVRYLMSTVTGRFRDIEAAVRINRDESAKSSVEFTMQAASIETGEPDRDEHLRSPDFFEVAKYPAITFKSTAVVPKSPTEFDVTGDLTMHGVTKRITVPVTFLGFARDPRGNEKAGFELATTLDRKDYNITWNRVLDEGGLLLGDEVKVTVELQLMKQGAK